MGIEEILMLPMQAFFTVCGLLLYLIVRFWYIAFPLLMLCPFIGAAIGKAENRRRGYDE